MTDAVPPSRERRAEKNSEVLISALPNRSERIDIINKRRTRESGIMTDSLLFISSIEDLP